MARFLAIAAVLGITVALTSTSEAGSNRGSSGRSTSHSMHQSSYSMHSYSSYHRGWSSWNWNSRYGCYFYFCPTANCNYYWYAPASCYYPVSYLAQYPPTQCQYQQTGPGVAPLPIQVTNNTNVNTIANGAPVPPLAVPVTPGVNGGPVPPLAAAVPPGPLPRP